MKSFVVHVLHALGLGCVLFFASFAFAQWAAPVVAPSLPSVAAEVPLDRVVAVVNDEAITQFDIDDSRTKTIRQLNEAKVPIPPKDVLDKQVLERLINERALMQFAKESGIQVDDTLVERTIEHGSAHV
mgnify:FL=1